MTELETIQIITERAQLTALAQKLGVRKDWHEPDEQGLTAQVFGQSFDNAGFWGEGVDAQMRYSGSEELHVVLYKEDLDDDCDECGRPHIDREPIAMINLATLLAWASDPTLP